jgi:hypothetical protein
MRQDMPHEFYTRLFVDTRMSHDELLSSVASLLGGSVRRWTAAASSVEADVRPNPDADATKLRSNPKDFIAFPFTIEVVTEQAAFEEYLANVATLMNGLHTGGASVVAACDWEDELPGGGALYSA